MYLRTLSVVSLLSLAMLLVVLNFTAPSEIGPVGILLTFGLIYLVMLGVATGFVVLLRKIMGRRGGLGKKGKLRGAVLALVPILLFLAQSIQPVWVAWLVVALVLGIAWLLVEKMA